MRTMGIRGMGQAQPKRTVLIVEDDAELRNLTAALLEDEQLDTIECESAEAALAVMLMHERDISMIFADVRLPGAMDGVDLAWEVKQRWPSQADARRNLVSAFRLGKCDARHSGAGAQGKLNKPPCCACSKREGPPLWQSLRPQNLHMPKVRPLNGQPRHPASRSSLTLMPDLRKYLEERAHESARRFLETCTGL
jgi:CheY-like chemotaxis protein